MLEDVFPLRVQRLRSIGIPLDPVPRKKWNRISVMSTRVCIEILCRWFLTSAGEQVGWNTLQNGDNVDEENRRYLNYGGKLGRDILLHL
jgi:hypothetical protein